jgi:hypothetical protein
MYRLSMKNAGCNYGAYNWSTGVSVDFCEKRRIGSPTARPNDREVQVNPTRPPQGRSRPRQRIKTKALARSRASRSFLAWPRRKLIRNCDQEWKRGATVRHVLLPDSGIVGIRRTPCRFLQAFQGRRRHRKSSCGISDAARVSIFPERVRRRRHSRSATERNQGTFAACC